MPPFAFLFGSAKNSNSQPGLTRVSAEPPRLFYDEINPRLSMPSFNGVMPPEAPSPERQLLNSSNVSTNTRSLIQGARGPKPMGNASDLNQAPDLNSHSSVLASHNELNPVDSSSPNSHSQRSSSTIGRTSGVGKSGKVIEKLASDLDSAHRERDLYKLRNEELERRLELMRIQIEELSERRSRAEQESTINATAISRKDRKIGELQNDLDQAVTHRTRADSESKAAIAERDEVRTTCDRKVARAQERAAFVDMSYQVVLKERERDKKTFQGQIEKLRGDLTRYFDELAEAQETIRKLNTLSEQKGSEIQKMDGTVYNVMVKYEKYVEDRDNDYQTLAGVVREKMEQMDGGLETIRETKDRMQWVMNVKENVELRSDETDKRKSAEVSKSKWKKGLQRMG